VGSTTRRTVENRNQRTLIGVNDRIKSWNCAINSNLHQLSHTANAMNHFWIACCCRRHRRCCFTRIIIFFFYIPIVAIVCKIQLIELTHKSSVFIVCRFKSSPITTIRCSHFAFPVQFYYKNIKLKLENFKNRTEFMFFFRFCAKKSRLSKMNNLFLAFVVNFSCFLLQMFELARHTQHTLD
jgi:hypothetical protein